MSNLLMSTRRICLAIIAGLIVAGVAELIGLGEGARGALSGAAAVGFLSWLQSKGEV